MPEEGEKTLYPTYCLSQLGFLLHGEPHTQRTYHPKTAIMPESRKKYALVGTGGRSSFFYSAIATDYSTTSCVVALCDTNQTRMNHANSKLEALGHGAVPTFLARDFDAMINDTKPDEVIVTTMDRTHNIYIVRAMELGCNVITEKPMTIDAPRCTEIFDAVERTGQKVRVTFNYRYAPHNTKVFEVIRSGAIGKVTSVHFGRLSHPFPSLPPDQPSSPEAVYSL